MMPKERGFKVNDLVEVTMWESDYFRKNWIIIGLASDGGEAIVRHLTGKKEQTIVELSKLKHQKREVKNDLGTNSTRKIVGI